MTDTSKEAIRAPFSRDEIDAITAEAITSLTAERDARQQDYLECSALRGEDLAALKQMNLDLERMTERAEKAEARVADLLATFDLRWKAGQRAIARWREKHPGNDLVCPDHADLIVWLIGWNTRLLAAGNKAMRESTALCKRADEEVSILRSRVAALEGARKEGLAFVETVRLAYQNPDITHRDFRVKVARCAEDCGAAMTAALSAPPATVNDPLTVGAVKESLTTASPSQAVCETCGGHGIIGGPSFREPDEGGEPCPDCCNPHAPAVSQAAADVFAAVPDDLKDAIRRMGAIEWGATAAKSAEEHAADMLSSVTKTAECFAQTGNQQMHGCYLQGSEVVICHTGTSPNSPNHARLIVGLWNWFLAEIDRLDRAAQAEREG